MPIYTHIFSPQERPLIILKTYMQVQALLSSLTICFLNSRRQFSQMSYEIIVCFSLFIPLFIWLFFKKLKREAKAARRLPPGPKKLPIIGNLHQLGKLPHRSLHNLSYEYGPLMLLQLGSIQALVVSSANMAREIFKQHDLTFSGRAVLYATNKITYNSSAVTFAPYGEYWKEMRKVLVLELLSAKKVQLFDTVRDEEVASMANCVVGSSTSKDPVNLSKLAFRLSNNVVCRVAFGRVYDENSKFNQILLEVQELAAEMNIADFFPWMAWFNKTNGVDSRLNKNFRELDSLFDEVIMEHLGPRRSKSTQEDIVDELLRIQGVPNLNISVSRENIKGVLLDILVAGTDTSAATLEWTLAELIKNPDVKRKAQQEVREVLSGKGKVEEADLSKLNYLKLVIKESFRMHPPAPLLVPRQTLESCIVGGYIIPAKTRVFVNLASISTDPTCWENPHEFKPERFSDSSVDFRGQNFELLPFGAGRRSCPAIHFAVPLIELALANLLLKFDWELPEGMVGEDLDMEEALGITIHKKTPLVLMASLYNE